MTLDRFDAATLRLFKGTLLATDLTGNVTRLPRAQLLLLTTKHPEPLAGNLLTTLDRVVLRRREPEKMQTRVWLIEMTANQHAWATTQMREIERGCDHRFRLSAESNTNLNLQGGWVSQLSRRSLDAHLTYGHALIQHTSETFVSEVCDKMESFHGRRECETLRDLLIAEHLPGL